MGLADQSSPSRGGQRRPEADRRGYATGQDPQAPEAQPPLVEVLLSLEELLFFVDEYRSEYQPPPLSTNPCPPETCRFAVALPQAGQSLRGASLMRCWASH